MVEFAFACWKRNWRLSIATTVRVMMVSESVPYTVTPPEVAASAVPVFIKTRVVSFPTVKSAILVPDDAAPVDTAVVGCDVFCTRNVTPGRIFEAKSLLTKGRSEWIFNAPEPPAEPNAETVDCASVTPIAVTSAKFTSKYRLPGQSGPCKE